VAWVCIGASVLGVVLLIIDALRERQGRDADASETGEDKDEVKGTDEVAAETTEAPEEFVDYPEETGTDASAESAVPADGSGEDSAK
jgi:hypothetical protein